MKNNVESLSSIDSVDKSATLDGIRPVKRLSDWWMGWWLVVTIGTNITLAITLPDDILQRVAAVGKFSEFMMGIIPSIQSYVTFSKFPQITELILAIQWVLVPIYVVFFLAWAKPNEKYLGRLGWKVYVLLFGSVWLAWMPMSLQVDQWVLDPAKRKIHNIAYRAVSESEFWLGLLSAMVCHEVAMVLACFLLLVSYIWRTRFRKSTTNNSANGRNIQ